MILHVIKSNIYSGAENVVCQIIKGLSDSRQFVYMAPHGPIEDKLKSLGLYDCYRGIDKLTVSAIRDAVDDLHPDIVQAHDFTAGVLCGLALKGRVPLISHIHCNPLWLKNRFHPKSVSYLYTSRYFSRIVAVSDAVIGEYCYKDRLTCPVTVLGNPFSSELVRSKAEIDDGDDLKSDILYVGRFNEAKNPLGAIDIAKRYIDTLPDDADIKVRMVGAGELLPEAMEYVSGNNLDRYFSFEGFQDNVYKFMKNTRILLMPSIFEGFGLVALEAMSLGVPVVCSGVGGLSDIVDDSCGYICRSNAEYIDALTELTTDESVYSNKSSGAITRAEEFDNIAEYLNRIDAIYEEL